MNMMAPALRRLMRDFEKLQEDPPAGVCGAPTEDNIFLWQAIIFGPADTPFEDGTFKLVLRFSEDYPNKPPVARFVSKIFHPNVFVDGIVCVDILQDRWSPTYDVAAILVSIQSLLNDPNPDSPANELAARLYRENPGEYEKRVQQVIDEVKQSCLDFDNEEDEVEETMESIDTAVNDENQRERVEA